MEKNKLILQKNSKPNTQELAIKIMIPEYILSDEAKNDLSKIKEIERNL